MRYCKQTDIEKHQLYLIDMDSQIKDDVWHRIVKSGKLKSGKKKMKNIGFRSIMVLRDEDGLRATDALCRHMAWPLAYGGKVEDGCITCPLHKTRYDLENGQVKEWSPFPLFPLYGKIVGKMRKQSPLVIHKVRESNGWIEVRLND